MVPSSMSRAEPYRASATPAPVISRRPASCAMNPVRKSRIKLPSALSCTCTTAVFYGLLTLVVLRWDQYWLTVPAAVLVAFLVLITLVVTAEVVFGAVPLVVMKPRQVLSILATVGTRLGSDCLSIIYLALMLRAVMR